VVEAAKLSQYAERNGTYFKGLFISIERFPKGKGGGRKEEVKVLEVNLISNLSVNDSMLDLGFLPIEIGRSPC
jgi:hypothetical protein